tara:strand:- start:1000 stop:1203 length:204 start_codon:yes stop_codon:yes gene_type:complete
MDAWHRGMGTTHIQILLISGQQLWPVSQQLHRGVLEALFPIRIDELTQFLTTQNTPESISNSVTIAI